MHNKKYLALVILITAAAVGCAKHQFLPVQGTPSRIFTVTKLAHTEDSVNVGDTLQLTATGTMTDTSKAVYVFLTSTYSANGSTVVQNFGTVSSPINVKYSAVPGATTGFNWTATITLIGATEVPDKTRLTIAATFQYQLSLSSQLPSSLVTTDAGQSNKTIYVR